MSRENVKLQHEAIDTFNRRDLQAYLALQDTDVEFTPYERAVEGLGPYRGHEGVRTWWEESFAAFPDLSAALFEVRKFGDLIVAHGRLQGTGAASGASFDRSLWLVVEWREAKTVWWHAFESEAEALEAVGLRE